MIPFKSIQDGDKHVLMQTLDHYHFNMIHHHLECQPKVQAKVKLNQPSVVAVY